MDRRRIDRKLVSKDSINYGNDHDKIRRVDNNKIMQFIARHFEIISRNGISRRSYTTIFGTFPYRLDPIFDGFFFFPSSSYLQGYFQEENIKTHRFKRVKYLFLKMTFNETSMHRLHDRFNKPFFFFSSLPLNHLAILAPRDGP